MSVIRSIVRNAGATMMAASVTVGASAVAAPGLVHAAPTGCAETFNLFIPGTWETNEGADSSQPIGMLRPVAEAIQREHGKQADIYFVPYMARAFDNGHTYADSKDTGKDNARNALRDYATRCPKAKYTITGYSQGADAAGDLASDIGNDRGPVSAEKVLAVGLLADPGSGTKGEATVGPRTAGTGIADPRPQGMGKLSGRVASICDPKDLYCSIQKGDNPVLSQLGSLLSKTPGGSHGEQAGPDSELASGLTSDFSKADLAGLATSVGDVVSSLTSGGTVNLAQVAHAAHQLVNTLGPLADLISSGAANNAATTQLSTAPAGTPENSAGQVLTKASQADLPGAISAVTTIADAATKLLGSGTTTLPTNSPDISALTTAAGALNGQIGTLASTSADILGSATGVLSVLKPSTMINQGLNVVTNITTIDFPRILRDLTELPAKVATTDAHGAHEIAGDLNNAFQPLVKLAAGVDLQWISSILSIIPDPSGFTSIAALVTSILSNVDVIRLANIVGQIQEVAWTAIEKLIPPPGQAPDLASAAAALTGLLPVGLDLASVAVNMLTGTAQKTSPQLLGKQTNTAASTISKQAENLDLNGLTGSLTQMATSQGADDLAALVNEGLSAANFFASGAHTNYGSLVVDNSGRNAVQWLGDWLNLQIGRAA
ncbi:cutinase family protein [Nocardia pseudovaccinii]|uniref:cutinase family protein n=1 Tax=Nocardia pseudovaccinii TaxID=189540 RepID=UPI0007A3DC36|nr:cutinase family protein [Nocardia pseudovaccinii]